MTVQEVFDIAIRLMDEQNESTGATNTADTKEYAVRVCSVLNSILDRVYPYSMGYPGITDGARPVCPRVSAMTDTLAVDDVICSTVLPNWLAYIFCLTDSSDYTAYFKALYEQALAGVASTLPAVPGAVEDVYGGIEYGEFGAW